MSTKLAASFEKKTDGTVTVKGVELLATGKWTDMRGRKFTVTEKKLDQIASNSEKIGSEISPGVKLGHVDKIEGGVDAPRFGTIANIRRSGTKLPLTYFTPASTGSHLCLSKATSAKEAMDMSSKAT